MVLEIRKALFKGPFAHLKAEIRKKQITLALIISSISILGKRVVRDVASLTVAKRALRLTKSRAYTVRDIPRQGYVPSGADARLGTFDRY